MDIEIDVTGAELVGAALGSLARSKMIARTVNDLAFGSRPAVVSELAASLTLRNRFSAAGIQIDKADMGDPNPSARVGIDERRSYLVDHVTGGKRSGGSHGRAIVADETVRSRSGRVPASKRPGAMIEKARTARRMSIREAQIRSAFGAESRDKLLPFLLYSAKWGNEVLARRITRDEYPLQIIYAFRRGVSIRKEFDMLREVTRHVGANYEQVFGRHLARAIAKGKDRTERQFSMSKGVTIDSGKGKAG